jgi:hypothetical protein
VHNETLSTTAMRVNNPDCSPVGIHACNISPKSSWRGRTRILWCVSECTKGIKGMRTIDSLIDFIDRLATPRMTDTQIEIIEKKLLNLTIAGDWEAARHYTDLSLSRLSWERTRSPEDRQNFVDQAQDAHAWLAVNSHETTTT